MEKESRKSLKARVNDKVREKRMGKKRIRALAGDEKREAKKLYNKQRREEKNRLKDLSKDERKREKRFQKKVKRRLRRPYVIAIWAVVIAIPVSLILGNYIQAVRPESHEIVAARAASAVVAEQVQAEGSVLLLNKDNVLPLVETKKINIFGARSAIPSYGGGGSGSINVDDVVSFYETMEEAGFELNQELVNLYLNWRQTEEISLKDHQPKKGKGLFATILPNIVGVLGGEKFDELPVNRIPDGVIDRATDHSNTALVMVGAFSREAVDASSYSDKTQESLQLDSEERKLIEMLDKEFDHIVVLINAGNPMELGWIEEYPSIKSVLSIGFPGEAGFSGVSKILSGEFTPSGKLTDTWAYDVLSAPGAQLTGDFGYTNLPDEHFINYNEGIYIGYRFYETYYENNEEGYWNAVQFPFGYGLSYTTFDWMPSGFSVDTEPDGSVQLSVTVTNTGEYSGKEVVQIYYTPPYYPESGIEKSAINLVDYKKTKELAPGEREVLTFTFPLRAMASYDYSDQEAWILEQGEYEITVAHHVHSFEESFSFTLDQDVVYRTDEVTQAEIKNLFSDAEGNLTYLSRNDFDGTMEAMLDIDYTAPQSVKDATEYVITPKEGTLPTVGAKNSLLLKDLEGLSIDDPTWDLFLDQFKLDEMIKLVSAGGWQTVPIKRLGVPKTLDYDGPASIRHYFGKWSTLGFPSATVVGQTWNDALQYDMARAMALEGVLHDIDIWYAPAMNLHRSALGARNFEYFSEDPVLSGRAGAALTLGAESRGMAVTIKHFALYTQETNRNGGAFTWIDEQALREIYLKPFEISVKEGTANGVMSAFPRIGHRWAGANSALLIDLLREEWGFEGLVVTDITIGKHMDASESITNGNDLMLFMLSGGHEKDIKEAYKIDPVGTLEGLRYSVRNILYTVLQTNAMEDVR